MSIYDDDQQDPYYYDPDYEPYYEQDHPQPHPGPAPYYQGGFGSPTEGNNTNGWAFGLGIAGLCCLPAAVAAIVVGKQGKDAADQGRATNGVLGVIGMVFGIVGCVLWFVGIAEKLRGRV